MLFRSFHSRYPCYLILNRMAWRSCALQSHYRAFSDVTPAFSFGESRPYNVASCTSRAPAQYVSEVSDEVFFWRENGFLSFLLILPQRHDAQANGGDLVLAGASRWFYGVAKIFGTVINDGSNSMIKVTCSRTDVNRHGDWRLGGFLQLRQRPAQIFKVWDAKRGTR